MITSLALQRPHCSLRKANKISEIDPLTGELVPLFHPLQQPWADNFELQADDRCVGRTPTGRATVVALQMNDPLPRIARALQYRLGLID